MNTARGLGGRAIAVVLAVVGGSILAVAPWSLVASASAATAFTQCNGIDDTPGLEVRCTADVTNRINLDTGITTSTVVATKCDGAAGTTPNAACTITTTNSQQLVSSVTQCNAAGNGSGGNLFCIVSITNIVVGAPTSLGVTVDQCVGSSGDGGGATPLACDPVQSTTNATVTQCNNSVRGGGADGRVACAVTGATTAIGVLIDQCNGSVNGGGSTAHCSASFTNSVTAGSSGGSGGTGGGTSGGGPATGAEGGSPSSPGSGGGTGTAALESALPVTGTDSAGLLAAGSVTLLAGCALLFLARRRAGARSSV